MPEPMTILIAIGLGLTLTFPPISILFALYFVFEGSVGLGIFFLIWFIIWGR